MYDMYPWNDESAGRGDDPPIPPRSWGDPSPQTPLGRDPSPQTPFVWAVQVALDRRDNGGDALTVAGQPAATQPAVTQPTAGRARQ